MTAPHRSRADVPGTHRCPGCGAPEVPNRLYACNLCWRRLPRELQHGVLGTVRAPWPERAAALQAAADFYLRDTAPAPRPTSEVCRSCLAPVLWRRTDRGAAMPVDPQPRGDGNLDLDDDGRTVHVLGDAQPTLDDRPRYVSHFVTCPYAELHRRRR